MQLPPQAIKHLSLGKEPLISPFIERTVHEATGMSGGLSCAGYDIHVGGLSDARDKQGRQLFTRPIYERRPGEWLIPPRTGCLGVTIERFIIPDSLSMAYFNKSTLARLFLNAAATLGEPGWEGHLTLELYNSTDIYQTIIIGQPIGQVIFNMLAEPSKYPYRGKYQGQEAKPVQARYERA